jgi:hypothetical protein
MSSKCSIFQLAASTPVAQKQKKGEIGLAKFLSFLQKKGSIGYAFHSRPFPKDFCFFCFLLANKRENVFHWFPFDYSPVLASH